MAELVFDIETIPLQSSMTKIQEEEFSRKFNKYIQKNPGEDPDAARRMLMATNPYYGEIVCIGLLKVDAAENKQEASLIGDEKKLLETFWETIQPLHKSTIYVSYNGLDFDVPFILKRSMHYGIFPSNVNFVNTKKFQKWPHFDVMMVAADFNYFKSITLRMLSEHNGITSPKEGGVKAENVEEYYKLGKINDIAEYCIRDLHATYANYKIVKRYTST